MRKQLAMILGFSWALTTFVGISPSSAAIFGADNRQYLHPEHPLNELARATAVAVLSANASRTGSGTIDLNTDSVSNVVCRDELFSSDPSLSYACTGFLVGPDLLLTAGHCLYVHGETRNDSSDACQAFDWLFDFQTSSAGETRLTGIPPQNLYHCRQIIYAVQDEQAPYQDFAIIQLDRPVRDRRPLTLSKDPVHTGDSVFMIGYPFGTPVKLTDGANVILNRPERGSFVTNLDAFEGNSGSPVFNVRNEVVGILVSGTPSLSLVPDEVNRCERYNRCDDDGTNCLLPEQNASLIPGFQGIGSDVQRITPVAGLIERQ